MFRMRVAAVGALWVAGLAASCGGGGARGGDAMPPDRRDAGRTDGSNDPPRAVDRAPGTDAPAGDVGVDRVIDAHADAGGPAFDADSSGCVTEGELHFSPPQVMFALGGRRSRAMDATGDRRLAVIAGWYGRPGVFYFDSLDGGRAFRPTMQLSQFGPDNVRIALGPRRVYLTSALFELYASVILWHGAVGELTDPSRFQIIQWGPPGTYVGTPVPAADGRVAMLLENDTLGNPTDGEYVSTAPDEESFAEPYKLFWPPVCAAGIYHSNGTLFMAYPLEGSPPQLVMRWSRDNGATFSDPVIRASSGGQVWCPKLYELPDGRVLVVTREGNALGSTQRVVAVAFDVTTGQFADAVIVDDGQVLCFDAARTTAGRLFVTSTFGQPGMPPQGVALRFSDDGGRTWSGQHAIPGIDPGEVCPVLAASDDELYLLWSQGDGLLFGRAGGEAACR
jgi:hypothetical protein